MREAIEALLKARGLWPELLERYFAEPAAACRLTATRSSRSAVGSSSQEAAAVHAAAAQRLDERFARAVRLLADASGRVIVSGVGKSGLIARKLAATLTSTGTAATYLHPVDSLHGDLGLVGRSDVAIVLSKSGESEELFGLVGSLQRMGVPIIAITGAMASTLARVATVALDGSVAEEACPHDLAPTTSTTVALALGDALAVALLEVKGFRREDFAALHPGGSLGRKLLLRVRDVMVHPGHVLGPDATMRQAVVSLAHDRGLAMVVDGGPPGRRAHDRAISPAWPSAIPAFLDLPVGGIMTRTPRTAGPDELAGRGGGHDGASRRDRAARWSDAIGAVARRGAPARPDAGGGGMMGGRAQRRLVGSWWAAALVLGAGRRSAPARRPGAKPTTTVAGHRQRGPGAGRVLALRDARTASGAAGWRPTRRSSTRTPR